jgi:nitroreductase
MTISINIKSQYGIMNQVIECINTRTSVRNYKDEEIPDEVIMKLLNLGFRGPNAMNKQALAFAVVKNRDKAKEYSDRAKTLRIEGEGMKSEPSEKLIRILSDENYNVFFNSPVQIFIFSSPEGVKPVEDGAIAAQNITLAAHSMGYGTCFIGFAQGLGRDSSFRADLNVPGDYTYITALALGVPAEENPVTPRNDLKILSWLK